MALRCSFSLSLSHMHSCKHIDMHAVLHGICSQNHVCFIKNIFIHEIAICAQAVDNSPMHTCAWPCVLYIWCTLAWPNWMNKQHNHEGRVYIHDVLYPLLLLFFEATWILESTLAFHIHHALIFDIKPTYTLTHTFCFLSISTLKHVWMNWMSWWGQSYSPSVSFIRCETQTQGNT